MKKVLVSALVAVMVFGLAATAFAAPGDIAGPAFTDIAGHDAEGELTLLGAMGVYSGEYGLGGPVNPDDPITRAQFCKVVVETIGLGNLAESLSGMPPAFADEIPTWAWGYVNVAVFAEIISGYPDGTFGPDNPVTYAEAVTMLVRAISGHDAMVGDQLWPYNYIFYGVEQGFTGDVDVGLVNLPASRGDIARMLFATMQINKLDKDGNVIADSAVLSGLLFEGLFEDYDLAADPPTVTVDGVIHPLADPVYIVGASDYESLRSFNVRIVLNEDNEVIFIELLDKATVVTGVFANLADADGNGTADTIVLEDGTEVPFDEAAGVDVVLNTVNNKTQGDLQAGDELTLTLGADGKAVNCVAHRFKPVDYITDFTPSEYDEEGNETAAAMFDSASGLNDIAIPADCQVTGDVTDRDKLAVNDVIEVAFVNDDDTQAPYIIRVVRQVVEGVVTKVTETYPGPVTKVFIGDTAYILDDTYLTAPGKDDQVRYGLDFESELFVEIAYTQVTPYVQLVSWEDSTEGDTVTVDNRGVEVTYPTDDDDYSGYDFDGTDFGKLTIDEATNTVTNFQEYTFGAGGEWEVIALSDGSMTLENVTTGELKFVDDPDIVIYVLDDEGKYVYGGYEALSVGDVLEYDDTDGMIWIEAGP
ncbi:MAG TPA: hypothetical protein DHW14_04605 [Clostridiales bacterium]|nr:hypothetical protein [Clostridiales bacterium]